MPRWHATILHVRRVVPPLLALAAFGLAACSQEPGREFARYYDDQGLFTLNLPAANEVRVTPPQPATRGPELLAGVISSPPAPSPSAEQAAGGFGVAPTEEPDQTIYQVFAVTSDGFADLDQMALYFLTGDAAFDVLIDDPIELDGESARLVVADASSGSQVNATVAAAMTLGDGQTGFVLAAIFPPGRWDVEEADFERIMRSFRSSVPPGLQAFPVTEPVAEEAS